jgi:DNA-binding transcriptional LysR family regulator
MELLQLQYFQTVARLEHMTKAAEALQIAQPSLSKTIARLEANLGVPLFDRQGRQLRLNAYGRTFLARVEKAFIELSEGRREIEDLAGLDQGSVTLAVSIPRILPELLGTFLTLYPNVRFTQFMESTSSMKRLLESGDIDFCISSVPIEGPDIEWQPLMTEDVFLLVPPEHPLAGRQSIRLIEAKDERFISMNAGFGFRDLTDEFCRRAGFSPYIAFEGDEPGIIGRLVAQGLGIAFVPALSLTGISHPKLKHLPIADPVCQRTIGLGRAKRRYLSAAARHFQVFAVDYFHRMSHSQ